MRSWTRHVHSGDGRSPRRRSCHSRFLHTTRWASPQARKHEPARSPRPSKEPMRSAPMTMAADGGPALNEVLLGHSTLVWKEMVRYQFGSFAQMELTLCPWSSYQSK